MDRAAAAQKCFLPAERRYSARSFRERGNRGAAAYDHAQLQRAAYSSRREFSFAVQRQMEPGFLEDILRGVSGNAETVARLHTIMRNYSAQLIQFVGNFLSPYSGKWNLDFASFRPLEEKNRDLPLHKRNDLLHVDAFPSRPTRGGRILRVFTNLNTTRPRVWTTTESFDALAQQYAKAAGLQQIAEDDSFFGRTVQSLGAKLGIGTMSRTPYDMFMLRFHDYLKENAAFQANCPKIRMEFPPLATWVVFTDSVAHAALSGQYAVEQTFL